MTISWRFRCPECDAVLSNLVYRPKFAEYYCENCYDHRGLLYDSKEDKLVGREVIRRA